MSQSLYLFQPALSMEQKFDYARIFVNILIPHPK